ncbi:uncharacterized protein LOC142529716 [Primulina tabacum]|uniref:uncharacterized protein LOC142529716 n=1 Tax=Primulina tabacum TaxID=48773 RepID=UPI003F59C56F
MQTSTGIPSAAEPPRLSEDIDSACSTPFVSAPSSPGNGSFGYFFSAPASPMHFLLSTEKTKALSSGYEPVFMSSDPDSFEFEFSSRLSPNGSGGNGSMISADELFCNGQIRPITLSSHLLMSQEMVVPFADLDSKYGEETTTVRGRDLRMRGGKHSHHRKARSMSPLRKTPCVWPGLNTKPPRQDQNGNEREEPSTETTPSCSASSSRSSSSGRNSKKWMFLKDFLHRSKSEGRENNKERFWSAISFSAAKDRKIPPSSPALSPSSSRDEKKGESELKKGRKVPAAVKPTNGVWKRRVPPSAHELHYTANRAQAEELKKRTFLPYRQGLLGCLGLSSKSYGAFSGFARNLNPISSRSFVSREIDHLTR